MPAPSLTKRYSDIDFAFTRTPGKNDIALSYDEMAVVNHTLLYSEKIMEKTARP